MNLISNNAISSLGNSLLEFWNGRTYPLKTGWQELSIVQDSASAFKYFVHEDEDWQALKSYQSLQENSRFFPQQIVEEKSVKTPIAVNPLWFFGLFLIGIGSLWLEPKL